VKLKLATIVAVVLWLCPQGFASSSTILSTTATYDDPPLMVSVTRANAALCDLELPPAGPPPYCTEVIYSFCLNETPGCQEGWMYINNELFKGTVGSSWTNEAVLAVNTPVISNGDRGESYYCYAWNSDGDCTELTVITDPSGCVDMTFTKVAEQATVSNEVEYYAQPGGGVQTITNINDEFTATAQGTVVTTAVTPSATAESDMGFSQATDVQKTGTNIERMRAHTKLSEKALRRLQAIRREQRAYTAKRKGDDLSDGR
jgi:hypothetical protein